MRPSTIASTYATRETSAITHYKYIILEERCKKCGACMEVCFEDAIVRTAKEVCEIDQAACTQCGVCLEACQVNAIKKKFSISVLIKNLFNTNERSDTKNG